MSIYKNEYNENMAGFVETNRDIFKQRFYEKYGAVINTMKEVYGPTYIITLDCIEKFIFKYNINT